MNLPKVLFLVFVLSLSLPAVLSAQTFPEANEKSYNLFKAGSWEELIDYADELEEKGFNFKNLYYRRGIAFYELGDYSAAADDFSKVVEYDNGDSYAHNSLYFSRVKSRQFERALGGLADAPDSELKQKTVPPLKIPSYLAIEGGLESYQYEDDSTDDIVALLPLNTSLEDYRKQSTYFGADLGMRLTYALNVLLNYSRISNENSFFQNTQSHYYIGGRYFFHPYVSFGLGYNSVQLEQKSSFFNSSDSTSNAVTAGELMLVLNQLKFSLGFSQSDFSDSTQSQTTFSTAMFNEIFILSLLFGKLNNSGNGTETGSNSDFLKADLEISFGKSSFSMKLNYFSGDALNYNLDLGKSVFNSADRTDSNIGATLYWNISGLTYVFGSYQSISKTDLYLNRKFKVNKPVVGLFRYF